jgi:hypothetical protein
MTVGGVALMVKYTINGWPAIETGSSPLLKSFTIPGTKRKVLLRRDIGAYLVAYAAEYHQKIAPIDVGTFDDWAWAPLRKGNASTKISDHCAGVALDLNATAEGSQSSSNVFWKKHPLKALAQRSLLKKFKLLEWGGDYKRAWDPMHVVIKVNDVKAVKAEMKRLGITATGAIKK